MNPPLTAAAARSLKRAANLAHREQAACIAPMHLLCAIVLDESRAAEFLAERGITKSDFAHTVPSAFAQENSGDTADNGDNRTDPHGDSEISEILIKARLCALQSSGGGELASEHLLWGLLAVDSSAAELLRSRGTNRAMLAPFCGLAASKIHESLEVDFEIEWLGAGGDRRQSSEHPASEAARTPGSRPLVPDVAPIGASSEPASIRIIDAAANRAREGLRVLEDFARFQLDDEAITRELKESRHEVAAALRGVCQSVMLSARDTVGDVGTAITTDAEAVRQTTLDLVTANFKRVQEALRTLEEFGKLLSPEVGGRFKQLRYRTYSLEKTIIVESAPRRLLADARIYLLVTEEFCELDVETVIRGALEGGVDVIQVREKSMPDGELLACLHRIRRLTRDAKALLIVNDRPDLAVLCDADGVHVGQDELPAAAARRIVGPNRLVGVSTHCIEQAQIAVRDGADYLGVGPVFPSTTKQFDEFPGLNYVGAVAGEIGLPWFAIGGIDADNVGSVRDAGATRVAVGRFITGDPDPAAATRRLAGKLATPPIDGAAPRTVR